MKIHIAKNGAASVKEATLNMVASTKSGMEKTNAIIQDKGEIIQMQMKSSKLVNTMPSLKGTTLTGPVLPPGNQLACTRC